MSVLSAWRNTPTLTLSYTQSSCFNDLITGEPDVVKSKSHRCVFTVLIRQHLYSCLYAHSSLHDFFLLNKVTKSKNKKNRQTANSLHLTNSFLVYCVFFPVVERTSFSAWGLRGLSAILQIVSYSACVATPEIKAWNTSSCCLVTKCLRPNTRGHWTGP